MYDKYVYLTFKFFVNVKRCKYQENNKLYSIQDNHALQIICCRRA